MPGNPLLARLKQYKEFIAILAAGIGGFVWFDGLVAKQTDVERINSKLSELAERSDIDAIQNDMAFLARQDTVDRISCLLKSYMEVSQRQLRLTQLNDDLTRNERKLELLVIETKLEDNPTLRQTATNQAAIVRESIAVLKTDIAVEDGLVRQIRNNLELQACDATH